LASYLHSKFILLGLIKFLYQRYFRVFSPELQVTEVIAPR